MSTSSTAATEALPWVWRDVLVVVGVSLLVALAVSLALSLGQGRQSRQRSPSLESSP